MAPAPITNPARSLLSRRLKCDTSKSLPYCVYGIRIKIMLLIITYSFRKWNSPIDNSKYFVPSNGMIIVIN